MPRFVSSPEDHSIRYNDWKGYVADMSGFQLLRSMENNMSEKEVESKSKYTRFMAFTREWIYAVVRGNYGASGSLRKSEHDYLELTNVHLDDDWLKNIMKVKNGEKLGSSFEFPTLMNKSEKDCVYDVFMPAYRALKESFDKRSIWEWFTNHSQYTAERDAIKALEGTMMALTRKGKEDIKTAYSEYCEQLPNYETETLDSATKEFEAMPKLRVPVSESQRTKYNQVTNQHGFDRKLRSDVYDAVKDIQNKLDEMKVGIALKIVSTVSDHMERLCNSIDEATVEGPQREAEVIERSLKFTFRAVFARLRNEYVGTKEALVKAQKIADIALKSHFPSLFVGGRHDALANNYITGNKEKLAEIVTGYSRDRSYIDVEDEGALIDEICNEVNKVNEPAKTESAPIKEEQTAISNEAELNKNKDENIKEHVDVSADLAESNVTETSPKVEENDVPVIESVKLN